MDSGEKSYRRYLRGDDEGLVEIIKEYKDGLILYLYGIVGNYHVAEELMEDTFVKLAVKKPRFFGKATFKTWLYAIGRNAATDHLRRMSRFASASIEECENSLRGGEDLERTYIKEEEKITLHRALEHLKNEYRQILYLLYFEGFSISDAAVIMKKSRHATETLAYRARQSLKKELLREGFVYEGL